MAYELERKIARLVTKKIMAEEALEDMKIAYLGEKNKGKKAAKLKRDIDVLWEIVGDLDFEVYNLVKEMVKKKKVSLT